MSPKDYLYSYLSNKKKGRVHIVRANGSTYCRVENNGMYTAQRLTEPMSYTNVPGTKRICQVCTNIILEEQYNSTHGAMDQEFKAILQ